MKKEERFVLDERQLSSEGVAKLLDCIPAGWNFLTGDFRTPKEWIECGRVQSPLIWEVSEDGNYSPVFYSNPKDPNLKLLEKESDPFDLVLQKETPYGYFFDSVVLQDFRDKFKEILDSKYLCSRLIAFSGMSISPGDLSDSSKKIVPSRFNAREYFELYNSSSEKEAKVYVSLENMVGKFGLIRNLKSLGFEKRAS